MTFIISRQCFQAGKILKKTCAVFSALKYPRFLTANVDAFRTPEVNPGNHTINDLGLFYTIPNSTSLDVLFKDNVFEVNFVKMCQTFRETSLLLRHPAWEIIHYLKSANYDHPINKYVLYGKFGNGKTSTMAQVIHYAYLSEWMIIHVPQVYDWLNSEKESVPSERMEGFVDLPADGCIWLSRFKTQNEALINKLDLKLHNDYKWNLREEQKKGESLLDLVNYGIMRGKHSCEVIHGVLEEVKLLSKSGKIKTLVAINGFNAMFEPKTQVRNHQGKFAKPEELSIVREFKNLVRSDWHNAAAVLSCYVPLLEGGRANEYFPLQLLTEKGFEYIDPFIPIEVPPFTEKEMISILSYYRSKKWLLSSEGDRELKFLSAGNGYVLQKLCAPL